MSRLAVPARDGSHSRPSYKGLGIGSRGIWRSRCMSKHGTSDAAG